MCLEYCLAGAGMAHNGHTLSYAQVRMGAQTSGEETNNCLNEAENDSDLRAWAREALCQVSDICQAGRNSCFRYVQRTSPAGADCARGYNGLCQSAISILRLRTMH